MSKQLLRAIRSPPPCSSSRGGGSSSGGGGEKGSGRGFGDKKNHMGEKQTGGGDAGGWHGVLRMGRSGRDGLVLDKGARGKPLGGAGEPIQLKKKDRRAEQGYSHRPFSFLPLLARAPANVAKSRKQDLPISLFLPLPRTRLNVM